MSLAVVCSRALDGLRAPAVQVEVHLANGLPSFTLLAPQLHFFFLCCRRRAQAAP